MQQAPYNGIITIGVIYIFGCVVDGGGVFFVSESSVTTEIVVRLPKQMVTELDGIGKQENKNRHELICQATQLLLRQHKTKKRYQHESMRRGYIEMGKINLGIASEAFLAEYEAAHTVERLVSGG